MRFKRIVSNSLLALLILAVAGMLVAGPRPQYNGAPDRVHVQYWEKWTGLEGQQMQQIVDTFNDTVGRKKGIWVDMVSMSQIDRKTIVSTSAGAPPDVAGLWDRQVLQFASMNALEPLDEYLHENDLPQSRYKPVYFNSCRYNGKVYALPSTGYCAALLWNKQVFADKADQLRAAGCDPDRPPATLAELDRYAAAIDTWSTSGGSRRLEVAGCVPVEPGSFTHQYPYWFGAKVCDPAGTRVFFTAPEMTACFDWIRSYSERIGKNQLAEFRSGFNAGTNAIFDTPQNPFLMGWISMEAQGTWMAAFIEKLAPHMNRWHVPAEQLQREKDFAQIKPGMTLQQVEELLGPGDAASSDADAHMLQWPAGIKRISITFNHGHVASSDMHLLPAIERQKYCQWGAAPWPSAVPGLNNVTYAGCDVWIIPSTAKHKKEAFAFLAFASQQKQLERLCSLHCNLSPLVAQSREYLQGHPNPYVDVFEALAASPNARPLPPLINWPQIDDEMEQAVQSTFMEVGTTQQILAELQRRSQHELNKARNVPENMYMDSSSSPSAASDAAVSDNRIGG